jgi:hypothetical protein
MADRGRKSAASLAVVAAMPGLRPEPPAELTPEQADVWRAVAATKPADWFGADTHPLLAGYCRHVAAARVLAGAIDAFAAPDLSTGEGLRRYGRLLAMRERETRAITALARSMRLTQQARYDARTANTAANRAGGAPRPWEFGVG